MYRRVGVRVQANNDALQTCLGFVVSDHIGDGATNIAVSLVYTLLKHSVVSSVADTMRKVDKLA